MHIVVIVLICGLVRVEEVRRMEFLSVFIKNGWFSLFFWGVDGAAER